MLGKLNNTRTYFKPKQATLPLFLSDFLDICDPVLTFDQFIEGIDIEKYLKCLPEHQTGRIRYNPIDMLKTVLFGFMTQGYMVPVFLPWLGILDKFSDCFGIYDILAEACPNHDTAVADFVNHTGRPSSIDIPLM